MRRRVSVSVVALLVVLAGVGAGVGAAAQHTGGASVDFQSQTSGGTTVTVASVTVPEGGFVTIHDASLRDGDAVGSVVGTSAYLEAGTHQDVEVTLEKDVETGTLVAMPHRDTDGDRTYEFGSSGGAVDGPYVSDGSPVTTAADVTVSASVSFGDQPTAGQSVVVDRVELSAPGFVTVHDDTLQDGETFGSIRGTSERLPAGVHEDVRVALDDPVESNRTLVPMAHRDTNDNGAYDFETSDGSEDGPFTAADGSAVVDTGAVTLADAATVDFEAQSSGGNAVVVDSVFLPAGGFVTMHDATLADGNPISSVRGTSTYLEPGLHRDVRVALDDPVADTGTLVAMPHRDTDGDRTYDFVESEGGDDGPYTADGGAVTRGASVTVSASVDMAAQRSDGRTVVVDAVDLSEGGFVTVHDARLFGGAAVESVVGTSDYLEAGTHENVTVRLDERVTESRTLVAMPHRDTDGDRTYDFVESAGSDDGPYTFDGGAVTAAAKVTVPASVEFGAQSTDGTTVTVDSVTLHDGGFVTIHDASLRNGEVFGSVVGTSGYLEAGTHTNVTVQLDDPVESETTLIAMPHRDTDGDRSYTFVESQGAADGPYVGGDGPVIDGATVSLADGTPTDTPTDTVTATETPVDGTATETSSDSPGFGPVVALVAALVAALALARRS